MRIHIALLSAVIALVWAGAAGAQAPINSYIVTQIVPPNLGGASALGVNDSGQVVGEFYGNDSALRAYLWQNGSMIDLGTLGGPQAGATAINNFGRVAGWSYISLNNNYVHGFVRDPIWGMRDLGTLGGTFSAASAINDSGHVVGRATLSNGVEHAFLWQDGRMYDLGTLAGYTGSRATAISSTGEIVGVAFGASGNRAFKWTPTVPNGTSGTMAALDPTLDNEAYGINTAGVAAGSAFGRAPILWDGTSTHELPMLYDSTSGIAAAINNAGQVIGTNLAGYWDEYWGQVNVTTFFVWDSLFGTRDIAALAGYAADIRGVSFLSGNGKIAANGVVWDEWGPSNGAFLLTPSSAPLPPVRLNLSPGDARIHLTWTASSGADSYNVKRSLTFDGAYTTIAAGVTGTSFVDGGLVNGTTYFYRVSAVNAWGESRDSNTWEGTPKPVPAAPTGLTGAGGDQSVELSWNASDWAEIYVVWRSSASGGPYENVGYTDRTSFVDYGGGDGGITLQNGNTYYYVVTAYNSSGSSGFSNEASATPQAPPPPPAPTGLTATGGDRTVYLAWNETPGAIGYYVKRLDGPGGEVTSAWVAYTNASEDWGRQNGVTYYYVVSAFNNGGESPNSNEASATPQGPPPPAPPTNLTASAAGKRKINLKWTQSTSSGILQNYIYRSTTNGGPYSIIATRPPGTSFSDTSVSSKVTYYYRVTATSLQGIESGFSNQAIATAR